MPTVHVTNCLSLVVRGFARACICWLAMWSGGLAVAADEAADRAAEILQASGVQGGLIVHLGCGDGRVTAALRANERFQVQGLAANATQVAAARKTVSSLGSYGPVAIDRLHGGSLPYIENMVNLLVVEDAGEVSAEEIQRVLVPGGVALTKAADGWKKMVKSWPDNIDEWTHYLHDAGGNAVADDDVVGPPRHLQWVGSPRWSRHHDRMASMSALVSAAGRIFYIMDEGSRISIQMPPDWQLIARDAFNGTVLWKQPIAQWQSHLWPLKSGPTQLARRLVAGKLAGEDTVFVTLGIREPVKALDAATGEVLRTYEESVGTEEILYVNGTLLLVVNPADFELADYSPEFNTGDQKRVATEFIWNEKPRHAMAVDAATGRVLWKKDTVVSPLTLTCDGERVFFHDGEKVVCFDRLSGEPVWASPPAARVKDIQFNFGPKLVVVQNVVLFAGGDRQMQAFDAKTGQVIWTAPHARGGYQSPEDLLVAGGLVWSAPTTSGRDSGIFTGRDLKTGEVKSEFPPNVDTYWFHHRCYIAKATNRFLIPSRTGIEFVDHANKDWDIHHWVRGGCLYGVMPCNGLLYAPPHNCACYPEAKLYGLNALAPASASRTAATQPRFDNRLERGPAFGDLIAPAADAATADWPTYRHDGGRTGFTKAAVSATLAPQWQMPIGSGGRLSAPIVAAGKLFVAEVDAHTIHAVNLATGKPAWSFIAGGRVDSPPTVHRGRLLFGSADGWVYCLRPRDGELMWRFRAAPQDRRLAAFEQVESVWPVHGSVLVQGNEVFCIAGRSNFLDGGLRFVKLNLETAELLAETAIDDRDPETGADIQERLQTLQMPTGLSDILSSDGQNVYLRSQQFDLAGNRIAIGPHSGDAAEQGSVQAGSTAHLFAPMGFLDDTWFHRSYWVFGRSFAGGHSGYFQAGKYTPSGQILVTDDKNVYGYGRKPEYLKWTTTLEHQLFSASKTPPPQARSVGETVTGGPAARRQANSPMIQFEKTASLNPANTPLAVEAWIKAERADGVVVARGGPAAGYSLFLENGKPRFAVRTSAEQVGTAAGPDGVLNKWTHLVGVLTPEKKVQIFVDGKLAAAADSPAGLIAVDPAQTLEIGADDAGAVGNYTAPFGFTGLIDQVKIFHGPVTAADVQKRFEQSDFEIAAAKRVLSCSFDRGDAADESGNSNHGKITAASAAAGKIGGAMRFVAARGAAAGPAGSFVKNHWQQDVPLLVRAMCLAGDTLFIAGPPDLIDEEATFQRIIDRDETVQAKLAEQNAALSGKHGALLQVISSKDGRKLSELRLDSLPVFDSLAAAHGRVFLTTSDGKVLCFGPAEK